MVKLYSKAMDPSPTPPRRFSHWKTTKRTFTFGKSAGDKPKTVKSPYKSNKNSVNLNKSLQKIPKSLVSEAIDQSGQSLITNSKKSPLLKSSETKKKKLAIEDGNVILEMSKDSDRDDSAETSSVDKENKDRSQDKQKGRGQKVKTINRLEPVSLTSQSATSNMSKRRHSLESLDEPVIHLEKLKTWHTKQGGAVRNSQSSDSDSEGSQAKRIKRNQEVNTQSQEISNATNRSTNAASKIINAANKSTNAANKSTNAANKSTNAANKSTNAANSSYAVNKSTNAANSSNAVNRSTNVANKITNAANSSNSANRSKNAANSSNTVNKSTNAANKSTNAANRSNNAINRSTNSSNGTHNLSSLEKNNNVSSESKRLSRPMISPDNLVLDDSSSRSSSLRNRSLLMSSQSMKEKRQYPLSYYYSSRKLSDKSNVSNTSMSKDFETSKTKKVDLSKRKDKISDSKNTISKSNEEEHDQIDSQQRHKKLSVSKSNTISKRKDKISKSKNTMFKSNEEEHDQIDSQHKHKKLSVSVEMIQLSKKGPLVVNKSTNLRKVSPSSSDDDSENPTEKHAPKKTPSVNRHEIENESPDHANSKRQSKKPQETSRESNCTDSQSEIREQPSKRKAESNDQCLPANHHSAVKKLKSSRSHEAVDERKTKSVDNVESSRLSHSDHSSSKTNPVLKSRPAGLRKSSLLSPPGSKQYPISYYNSGRHRPDHSSDKETSGFQKSGQTVNSALKGPVHSQKSSRPVAEVNVVDLPAKYKKPEPKSRKLKAGKVSSSDSVVISNHLMRSVTSDQDFDLDIIAPEPQIASKEVTRKKGVSQRVPHVKSTQATVKAGQSKSQDLSQNETVLASQVKQRKRNLVQEFDATQKNNDVSQNKKGQSREVHVWCEDGRSRPGSDVTAYDVLLENLDTMEEQLKEDDLDMNSQEMITKVMDDLRSQIQSLLLKRLDIKGLERDIRKVKARCSQLKKDLSQKQKENFELSSRMDTINRQSKDVNLLLASCWMKDYARLMEALDNQHD